MVTLSLLIPYIKWIVLIVLIPFYYFLFSEKKNKWIIAINLFSLGLVCLKPILFELLNVTAYKGSYTAIIIEAIFFVSFVFLCIAIFRDKVNVYKKVITAFIMLIIVLIFTLGQLLSIVGGFNQGYEAEKYFILSEQFKIRKNYIDYGMPVQFDLIENKYLFFKRERSLYYELNDYENKIDSLKFISFHNEKLKFNVYKDALIYPVTINLKYDEVYHPTLEYFKVGKNGKYGFIDRSEKEVIPLIYDNLGDFQQDGTCWALKNGKQGYINEKNQIVKAFK